MRKFYSLLIILSAFMPALAQIPQTPFPANCNASNCVTNANIDVCPPGSNTVVTSHTGGTYNRGNTGNRLGEGAVYRFRNIATVGGVTVNGEIKIDQIYNARLESIDDDGAVDQGGKTIASFFAPRISPDNNLNGTDRRGYVQFTMTFFRNANGTNNNTNGDFAETVSLTNINYVHYDIDGNDASNVTRGTAGSWFRETGVAQRITTGNPIVLANTATDLSAYNYTDGSDNTNWTGFAGTVCERDGVSRCAEVASSFSFSGSLPGISVRMGYDYNAGGNVGRPVRQYGSRLGCFNFPSQSTLPVNLLSFSGVYRNLAAHLNWSADGEINFEKYVVERSTDGKNFSAITEKSPAGNGGSRADYQYTDDIQSNSASSFYYRLRMVDRDGTFIYSKVVLIRKESKQLTAITINPNPVRNGLGTIRFQSESTSMVNIAVNDMAGRTVIRQQQKVYDGMNSISLGGLEKLQPGFYTLQLINDGEISVLKFSIVK